MRSVAYARHMACWRYDISACRRRARRRRARYVRHSVETTDIMRDARMRSAAAA